MTRQTGTAQTDSVTESTTIEVMLNSQQLGALANSRKVDAPQHRKLHIVIGIAIAAVLVVLGGVAHLAAKQTPAPQTVVQKSAPPPPPAPIEPPAPAGEPVRLKNPFDRSEVFEFPPGTTHAEARDAVAKLLLERAQGRGPDVIKLRIRKPKHAPKPA